MDITESLSHSPGTSEPSRAESSEAIATRTSHGADDQTQLLRASLRGGKALIESNGGGGRFRKKKERTTCILDETRLSRFPRGKKEAGEPAQLPQHPTAHHCHHCQHAKTLIIPSRRRLIIPTTVFIYLPKRAPATAPAAWNVFT